MEDRVKALEEKVEKLERIIEELTKEQSKVKYNEFVGMEIKNFYCNGFFGRDFSLEGSKIIENTDRYLTIRKPDGEILRADLDVWSMREHVKDWTTEQEDD